ncbi:MAG: ATP-binding protein [Fibrobacteres bacterium]|nr:ATP-binding protein [Fibrobacterota bacterium]
MNEIPNSDNKRRVKMMHDDWRDESNLRLEKSALYSRLRELANDDLASQKALGLTSDAVNYSVQRTKTIIRHMGEYTLHDADHSFRVLNLMERLIGSESIKELSSPELMLLILCAFFHDIGMAPSESEVLTWKKFWDNDSSKNALHDDLTYQQFARFCFSKPERIEEIQRAHKDSNTSRTDLLKGYLISDYIRSTHADRVREIIQSDWLDKITFRDTDLTVEFADLCVSHNQDAMKLLDFECKYLCGPHIFANMRLIATILRIADILDFDSKRTPDVLISQLFVRHPTSISEWNKHRSIESWNITPGEIQFHAKCNHPAIELGINEFCDLLDQELASCRNLISSMDDIRGRSSVYFQLPARIDRSKIETKKDINGNVLYLYRRTAFHLDKSKVIDILMGTKLYGDPKVAIRELVQNSIDACLLRRDLEESWGNAYEPKIEIKYLNNGQFYSLEVHDNGTGMDQNIIDNYYTNIGKSFYKSADYYDLSSQTRKRFTPTSRFGIGALSIFMITDSLQIETRRVLGPHESSEALDISVEGQESVFCIRRGKRKKPGTAVKIQLKEPISSNNPYYKPSFHEIIRSTIPNPPFEITIYEETKTHIINEKTFYEKNAADLLDYSWKKYSEVQIIPLEIENREIGILGTAVVAILTADNLPTFSASLKSYNIEISGKEYNIKRRLSLSSNHISLDEPKIAPVDDGEISIEDNSSYEYNSKSQISLHGIDIPAPLFPDPWKMRDYNVKFNWPIPVILKIDIRNPMDLDLNASRTQFLHSEKWDIFERAILHQIFNELNKKMGIAFMKHLKDAVGFQHEQFISFCKYLDDFLLEQA